MEGRASLTEEKTSRATRLNGTKYEPMMDIGTMHRKTQSETRPRVFASAPQEDGRLQMSQNKRKYTELEVELTGIVA